MSDRFAEYDQFPELDYTEFDYKNTEDESHKRHIRKLLEDRKAIKHLQDACRDEWDEDENEDFEWEKML